MKLCRTDSSAPAVDVHALGGSPSRNPRILATVVVGILVALVVSWGMPAAAHAAARPAAKAAKKSESTKQQFQDQSSYERGALSLDTSTKGSKAKQSSPSSSGAIGRMLFGLVFVVGLIFGVHKLLQRVSSAKLGGATGSAGVIEIVATTPLSQGRALHLIRVGREMVLVGATDQSISQIARVDGQGMLDDAGQRGDAEFQAALHGALNGPQGGGSAASSLAAAPYAARTTTTTNVRPAAVASGGFWTRFVTNLQLMTSRT